jgi:hypothetical protein
MIMYSIDSLIQKKKKNFLDYNILLDALLSIFTFIIKKIINNLYNNKSKVYFL